MTEKVAFKTPGAHDKTIVEIPGTFDMLGLRRIVNAAILPGGLKGNTATVADKASAYLLAMSDEAALAALELPLSVDVTHGELLDLQTLAGDKTIDKQYLELRTQRRTELTKARSTRAR